MPLLPLESLQARLEFVPGKGDEKLALQVGQAVEQHPLGTARLPAGRQLQPRQMLPVRVQSVHIQLPPLRPTQLHLHSIVVKYSQG